MSRTRLVLLGTGNPNLHPDRYQSSLAVIVDDVPYIVDCGGGTVQRLSQAQHEKGISALAAPRLSRLFLTHLHPDHTTGLPDFIIALWLERPAAYLGTRRHPSAGRSHSGGLRDRHRRTPRRSRSDQSRAKCPDHGDRGRRDLCR